MAKAADNVYRLPRATVREESFALAVIFNLFEEKGRHVLVIRTCDSQKFLLILSVVLLLAFSAVSGQDPHTYRISLPPGVQRLLTEVEKRYGKKIDLKFRKLPQGTFGESHVSKDGTPTMIIDSTRGPHQQCTPGHEALHLLDKIRGLPEVRFKFGIALSESGNRTNVAYADWLRHHLLEPIQHARFYSDLRDIGLDPDSELRKDIGHVMQNGESLKSRSSRFRTLYFYKARLEVDKRQQQLVKDLELFYIESGWTSELYSAIRLENIVDTYTDGSQIGELGAFVQCLKVLLTPQERVDLESWDSEWRGSTRIWIVTIRIDPPD